MSTHCSSLTRLLPPSPKWKGKQLWYAKCQKEGGDRHWTSMPLAISLSLVLVTLIGSLKQPLPFPLDIMKYTILLRECQHIVVVWPDYYTKWTSIEVHVALKNFPSRSIYQINDNIRKYLYQFAIPLPNFGVVISGVFQTPIDIQ